jgi:hypothetical protein
MKGKLLKNLEKYCNLKTNISDILLKKRKNKTEGLE